MALFLEVWLQDFWERGLPAAVKHCTPTLSKLYAVWFIQQTFPPVHQTECKPLHKLVQIFTQKLQHRKSNWNLFVGIAKGFLIIVSHACRNHNYLVMSCPRLLWKGLRNEDIPAEKKKRER